MNIFPRCRHQLHPHIVVGLLIVLVSAGSPEAGQKTGTPPEIFTEPPAGIENPENRNEDPAEKIFGMEERTADQIFGRQGGRIHPYVSVKEEWTDNLYNINTDEQTNLLTILSPGIWIGFPRLEEIPVSLTPHNEAIGGMRFSIPGSDSFDRFQAYLLAGADYRNYSAQSDLNYTAWRGEGLFQYTMPAGISFRILDRLTRDRDRYDIGSFLPEDFTVQDERIMLTESPSRVRDYYSNQAYIAVNFELNDNSSLLFDYINFYLDYDDEVNDWLDRMDNRYSLSLKYDYSPKTSLILEYDFADIRYDTDSDNNSRNSFYYAGIKWKATAKTSLTAKGGYQFKEYDTVEENDNDTFSMELDLNYLITDKTKITLNLYKALEETDSFTSRGKNTIVSRVRYDQNFTLRIKGNVEFWYETSDYSDLERTDFIQTEDDRDDKRFLVRPAVQYIIRDWLMAELAYSFENRNSSDNLYDFTTHTLIFSLHAAL